MDLNFVLAIIAIVSPVALSFIWSITLITKISNRALLLEVASTDHLERIKKLEAATSYSSIEKVVERVCLQVFNSKDFKEALSDSVKNTLMHLDRNRSHAEAGALDEVLDEIKRLHADIVNHRNHV